MPIAESERSRRIAQAEIRAMTIECEAAGGVNLAQGVCDTGVPAPVRTGAIEAIESGVAAYTHRSGLLELRRTIAGKLASVRGIDADPESQITVSAGATGAFYCACMALLDPGDEVVFFEPYYTYHVNLVESLGAVPRFVATRPPDWSWSVRELEEAVSPVTRAVIVNTPTNPSGKVFDRRELEELAEVARRHDLMVVTDEIYEHFVYDGAEHVSPASLPGMAERTITVSGFSKTFSITGWRIGFAVAPPGWSERIGRINDLVYVCAPAPLQLGVARGIASLGEDAYRRLASTYRDRRDRLCATLAEVGLEPLVPRGAYYVLADARRLPGDDGAARARLLLEETGVAAVGGDAFWSGDRGATLLRFCFAVEDAELEEACRRLRKLDG